MRRHSSPSSPSKLALAPDKTSRVRGLWCGRSSDLASPSAAGDYEGTEVVVDVVGTTVVVTAVVVVEVVVVVVVGAFFVRFGGSVVVVVVEVVVVVGEAATVVGGDEYGLLI